MSRPTLEKLTRAEKGVVFLLAAINFNHILDFVIVMPLGDRMKREVPLTEGQFADVVSSYGIAAALGGIFGAGILDRVDRKKALLFLFGGFILSTVYCGYATSYSSLVTARALAGGFGGLASTCIMAIIGDVFEPDKRGRATGVVMSAFALATIFGLTAGIFLAMNLGRGAPFYAIGILSVFVWVFAASRLPNFRTHLARERRHPVHELAVAVSRVAHLRAFLFMILIVGGNFMVVPFIAPYFMANCGLTEANLIPLYAISGVCTLVSMNVIGRLADRFGKPPVFRVFGLITVGLLVLITHMPHAGFWAVLFVTCAFMVASSGRMVPAQAILVGIPRPENRGPFLAVNNAVSHLSMGLGPQVYKMFCSRTADGTITGYDKVGLISAACAFVAVGLSWTLIAAKPQPVVVVKPMAEPAAA
ncbi:MAG TPA: MFS transporter [Fimbriiglobus sp.]|jgi:predicted MFS family arabinose efflux permease